MKTKTTKKSMTHRELHNLLEHERSAKEVARKANSDIIEDLESLIAKWENFAKLNKSTAAGAIRKLSACELSDVLRKYK